jgi:hypothetical protein
VTGILVGTADGLHELGPEAEAARIHHAGRDVTAVAPEGPELWAILDGREIWHTAGIEWWVHVSDLDGLGATCLADTRAGVVVGTSEAHLYRVAGEGVEPVHGFDAAPGRDGWYTPWGGPPDTRSISEDSEAVYVNVHVGGILRSRDKGETWEPTIDVDADVHKVWASTGRVFAPCARGLAVSEDQGDSWSIRTDGLHASYCRAVAVCGETVLVSASEGPRGGRSAVYRGAASGGRLERCEKGLPEWFEHNIDSLCLDATPELAAFGTEDGRVIASTDEGATWDEIASGLLAVSCVLVVPG